MIAEPIEVRRGPYLESTHSFSACVTRADGRVLYALGDIERPYPVRSLAKPFVAIELVRTGAADAFGLGNIELSLAAGSHDGENRHISAVRSFLAKIGLAEEALLCGPAMEGRTVVGPPIANNCSGKHAAVLALCRHLSLSPKNYTAVDHPVQRRLTAALVDAFERKLRETPLATDGCGMPIFGSSLRQIAIAYARFGIANDPAVSRVRHAMIAESAYAGGWNNNLDTRIISRSEGTIIGKIGAEGLHADALVGHGIGLSIKIRDGNSRALSPVLAQLFSEFAGRSQIARQELAELAAPTVLNALGNRVGEIRVAEFSNVDDSIYSWVNPKVERKLQ